MSTKAGHAQSRPRWGRRLILFSAAAVGGGLALGTAWVNHRLNENQRFMLPTNQGGNSFGAWLTINSQGLVNVAVPHQDMGQGILSTVAMLAAEELDLLPAQVRPTQAPINGVYANTIMLLDGLPFSPSDHGSIKTGTAWTMDKVLKALGVQATGGSTSLRNTYQAVREAAASARQMLIAVAAKRLNVNAQELSCKDGKVIHGISSRSLSFGELASEAASLSPIKGALKEAAQYRYLGKPMARLDVPEKVDGTAQFGIDVRQPGQLYAAIRHAPVFGATLKEAGFAANLPAVKKTVQGSNFIAVIADSWWQAKQAIDKANPTWNQPAELASDVAIFAAQKMALDKNQGRLFEQRGDVNIIAGGNTKKISAEYSVPYLAHATMEPMNCTVRYSAQAMEIWCGNQSPTLAKWLGAQAAGLESDKVTVNTPYLGGGFGRRAEMDVVREAVVIAKELPGTPIQLIWSREEDMQHDVYRPSASCRFEGGIDANGSLISWRHHIAGPSVTAQFTRRIGPLYESKMPDKTNAEGATWLPYAIDNLEVKHALVESPVPVGFWRSVGHSYNAFFVECFLDECAVAANKDPIAFRLALLRKNQNDPIAGRFAKLLETVAAKANWAQPVTPVVGSRVGRGVAIAESFHSIVAQIVEIAIDQQNKLTVTKVVAAVDSGVVIDPSNATAQIRSAVLTGLSAALFGQISIEKGRVAQSNFTDYPMVKLGDAPPIEVHFVNSGAPMGGMGEVGTPPLAPALANAVFATLGQRLRNLPLKWT
jgi:isoquinoline 1-oxidoreductase subunit beta